MIRKLFIGKDDNGKKHALAWTAASGIVYSCQSIVFLMIITNLMGDSAAGLYSVGMMVAQQMLTVGKFSVRNFQVSDIRQKYSFGQYYTFRICTCILALFITAVWIVAGGYRGEEAVVIVALTIYKMAECMSDLFEGLYQQRFRLDVSGKSQFTKDIIMIAVFVLMIVFTRSVVAASVTLAVVSLALVLIVDFPTAGAFAEIDWQFDVKTVKELTAACFSLFVSSFFYVFIHNSPKYAIKSISGDDNSLLAVFNALFMPVFVVDLFAGFTMRLWLTGMAVYHEENNFKGFKGIIIKQTGIIAGLTAVTMVGMYLFGGKLLSFIYGLDLDGYEWTNALLMLSGGLVAIYTLFENVIIIYRHQQASIFINIGTAASAALIITPMTIHGGILGASAGYVIVNGIRAAGYFIMALYYMKKDNKKETVR